MVDDSPTMCDVLGLWLDALGWTSSAAGDAPSALEQARAGNPDLIITDQCMPGMTGVELVSALRAAGCSAHVLVLSADASVETLAQALLAGADDYLVKPLTFEQLAERLPAARAAA